MTRRTTTRRTGVALMEVLVALGLLALGLLALLTLFPLSAAQLGIAVREDRSAQAASQAEALFRSYWKTEVVEKRGGNEPFFAALDDPNANPAVAAAHPDRHSPPGGVPAGNFTAPNPDDFSYPVVIDPMGWFAPRGSRYWVGDAISPTTGPHLPRRTLNLVTGQQHALRLCSLMDGLGYAEDGRPVQPGNTFADRELRYNWLWIVQRPVNANSYNANLTVVVFENRPHLYGGTAPEAVFSNALYVGGVLVATVPAVPGETSVTLFDNANGPPDVKPGGWILDATSEVSANGATRIRHANLYQVVSLTPGATAGSTVLELQTPLKPRSDRGAGYTGTFIVLRGVSGVYPKPPLLGN